MTQPVLDFTASVPPVDSHVLEPGEIRRLAGQNLRILERLQRGAATNKGLSRLSLKYTSRVSDLRKAGYVITAYQCHGGLTIYRLGKRADCACEESAEVRK
jgi:hypothetical protein